MYDTRKTDAILSSLKPRVGVPCPIVSLHHVRACASHEFSPEGVLVGTLQGGWFLERSGDEVYPDHQLILPEGKEI